MPGHSIVCELLLRGKSPSIEVHTAHTFSLYCTELLFAALYLNPVTHLPSWKLTPQMQERCTQSAATKFVSQGFRNSGNPGQRC